MAEKGTKTIKLIRKPGRSYYNSHYTSHYWVGGQTKEGPRYKFCKESMDMFFDLPARLREVELVLHKQKPKHDDFVWFGPGHDPFDRFYVYIKDSWKRTSLLHDVSETARERFHEGYKYATIHYYEKEK